ncbi:MAG: PEGA domain-containing protein, partial [Desulfobulbales bacterium]
MSRLLEIYDHRGIRQLTDSDLPLIIGTGSKSHILLTSGRETEAYIGLSKGHLFLQPAADSSPVLHNDTIITASVWIKSGDTTRIGTHILHYEISGDRVEIRLSVAVSEPVIQPPARPQPENIGTRRSLPRISGDAAAHPVRTRLQKLAAALLLLLLLAAGFVLASRSLEITVHPEPDSISISRFPPVIKLGNHYLGLKGRYTLKATKEGYQILEAEVIIADRTANPYTFTMTKLPGRIDLITDPVRGAEVFINDSPVGQTPLRQLRVPAGEQRILIRKDRYLDFAATINVEGLDHEQRFEFSMSPAWSEVTLITAPAGASVLINGEENGITPVTLNLLTGTYRIVFQKNEYTPSVIDLTVPA